VGFLLASLLVASCAWSSYVLAARLQPAASTSVRLCAQALIACFALVLGFFLLAAVQGFRPGIAIALWLVAALAIPRFLDPAGEARRLARRDLEGVAEWWRELRRSPALWIFLAFALLLGARLALGLVRPPLAWDSLTYHLVHAARWVQEGGFARELAPDDWGFYEHFPPGGEVLWAWAMLPVRGDALLAAAGVGVLLLVPLATYACARVLGASRSLATAVAVALASTPAILAYATTSYVDNTALAFVALGLVFLARNGLEPARGDALLAAAALGLAAAVKHTAIPLLLVGLAALLLQILLHGSARLRRPASLAGVLLPSLVVLPHLLRTWAATGNPLYPFDVELLGRPLFEGNPEWSLVMSGAPLPDSSAAPTAGELLASMFGAWPPGTLNLGPTVLPLLLLGLLGLPGLLRRSRTRILGLVLLAVAAIAFWTLALSDGSHHLRRFAFFWSHSGRYVTSGVLGLAVLASVPRAGRSVWLWCGLAACSMLLALPRGISGQDVRGLLWLALLVAIAALPLLLAWRGRRLLLPATLLAIALFGGGLGWIRAELRYPIYQAAMQQRAMDAHALNRGFASSWTIWRALDELDGQRIAVATGWGEGLHNSYRYPLLGSRLQHRLVYVPPTLTGELVSYRDPEALARLVDRTAWLRRLVYGGVDLVVTLEPDTTPESRWMEEDAELFERIAVSGSGRSFAYRLDRVRACAAIGAATPIAR
jgi:4-amino-4-deoxy-L-arabinose transferase-like glycosyltransferase